MCMCKDFLKSEKPSFLHTVLSPACHPTAHNISRSETDIPPGGLRSGPAAQERPKVRGASGCHVRGVGQAGWGHVSDI